MSRLLPAAVALICASILSPGSCSVHTDSDAVIKTGGNSDGSLRPRIALEFSHPVDGLEGSVESLLDKRVWFFSSHETADAHGHLRHDNLSAVHEFKPLKRSHRGIIPLVHEAPRPPPAYLREKREQLAAASSTQFGRYEIKDPLFINQWHLLNRDRPGHDVNVAPVWREGIYGNGTTIVLIDDGKIHRTGHGNFVYRSDRIGILDEHVDIAPNFRAASSWDVNDGQRLPRPLLASDYHGTRCAGQVVGVPNEHCGVGVAFEAGIAGIRMLSREVSSGDEARVLAHRIQDNHIFSCSWG